jgi:hypothetical protein
MYVRSGRETSSFHNVTLSLKRRLRALRGLRAEAQQEEPRDSSDNEIIMNATSQPKAQGQEEAGMDVVARPLNCVPSGTWDIRPDGEDDIAEWSEWSEPQKIQLTPTLWGTVQSRIQWPKLTRLRGVEELSDGKIH